MTRVCPLPGLTSKKFITPYHAAEPSLPQPLDTPDGITVSPDGKTVYGADFATNHVLGWDILSGNPVFDSGLIPVSSGDIDGLAVVSGTCSIAGDIVVNNNDGTVGLIDPTGNNPYSVIANGGSRGDFVSPDKSNGSLLVSQSDRLMRLTPPTGCSIGSTIPEPDDLALFALGFTALAVIHRRRERGRMSRPAQRVT